MISTCPSQVIEHQPQTGRPHHHGVGWARNLPTDVVRLMERLQQEDASELSCEDLEPVLVVAKAAVTVSTRAEDIMQQFPKLNHARAAEVGRLALLHQHHSCTSLCKSSEFAGQLCNKFFPQLPSLFCLVARTPFLNKEGQKKVEDMYAIHVKIQQQLRNHSIVPGQNNTATLVTLLETVADPPQPLPNDEGFTWQGVVFPNGPVLHNMHQRCLQYGRSPREVHLLSLYHMSLLTRRHAKYYPVRSVSEAYIAKFNPIILLATQSNIEVDIITHTPHTWFYYMTKSGESQTSLRSSQRELVSRGENDNAVRLGEMLTAKKREVTLGEAFFLLDPQLSLTSSNVVVRFVTTSHHPAGVEDGGVLKRPDQTVVVNYASRFKTIMNGWCSLIISGHCGHLQSPWASSLPGIDQGLQRRSNGRIGSIEMFLSSHQQTCHQTLPFCQQRWC